MSVEVQGLEIYFPLYFRAKEKKIYLKSFLCQIMDQNSSADCTCYTILALINMDNDISISSREEE